MGAKRQRGHFCWAAWPERVRDQRTVGAPGSAARSAAPQPLPSAIMGSDRSTACTRCRAAAPHTCARHPTEHCAQTPARTGGCATWPRIHARAAHWLDNNKF